MINIKVTDDQLTYEPISWDNCVQLYQGASEPMYWTLVQWQWPYDPVVKFFSLELSIHGWVLCIDRDPNGHR
jgi:hypothetical protein